MNTSGTLPRNAGNKHTTVTSQFFLASSAFGLLVGLFEAARLWRTPRVAVLLYPDVRYVIWFLAPLVDMVFFGLVGLVLGWMVRRTGYLRIGVAVAAGIATAFVALMLRWFDLEVGMRVFQPYEEGVVPLAFFGAGLVLAFVILLLARSSLTVCSERRPLIPLKLLALALLAAAVVAVVGVGVFIAQSSYAFRTAQAASAPASQSPSIILITLDTLRADHLSSYGYARPTTPHLDRFARRGVLFENAISGAPWTLAGHASLFTGLLPHQHGAGWSNPLSSRPWTLAEVLHSRGYETAGFTANFLYCQKGWGIAQGFETYEDDSVALRHNLEQTLVGDAVIQPLYQNLCRYDSYERRDAAEINRSIFGWFRHRSTRPFFLFINYLDCHEPYLAPAPYRHRFGTLAVSLARRMHLAVASSDLPPKFSEQEQASLIAGYDNSLAYLDEQVGQLLEFLRQSPEGQNTIVIITADHGEEFGEHGRYSHGHDIYREVLHVPLIIVGPGVPQNRRIQHPVRTRDLFPTVLDLAEGGKNPFGRTSLARFWKPDFSPEPFDDMAVSELAFPWFWQMKAQAMISLMTPEWQYIYDSAGDRRLYRWAVDPQEKTNLAASAAEQATVQNLHNRLVEMVRNSLGPWLGGNYMISLVRQDSGFRNALLVRPSPSDVSGNGLRVGAAQTYFNFPQSWTAPKPSPSEEDLMRSLPYH